jgi:hypothetical protein
MLGNLDMRSIAGRLMIEVLTLASDEGFRWDGNLGSFSNFTDPTLVVSCSKSPRLRPRS